MVNKCKHCNAVVNPKWKQCFACGAPQGAEHYQQGVIPLEQIQGMDSKEFAQQNLAIKLHSRLLGKDIWLVSNVDIMNQLKDEGLAVYLPHEIEYLVQKKAMADEIKTIHMVKEVFPGSSIVSNKDFKEGTINEKT